MDTSYCNWIAVKSIIEPETILLQAMKEYDTSTPNRFVVGIVDQLKVVKHSDPHVLLSFAEFESLHVDGRRPSYRIHAFGAAAIPPVRKLEDFALSEYL